MKKMIKVFCHREICANVNFVQLGPNKIMTIAFSSKISNVKKHSLIIYSMEDLKKKTFNKSLKLDFSLDFACM